MAENCEFNSRIAQSIEQSINTGIPIPLPDQPNPPTHVVREDINGILMNPQETEEWERVPGNNFANHTERQRETVVRNVELHVPVEHEPTVDLRWLNRQQEPKKIIMNVHPNCIKVPPLIVREEPPAPCPPETHVVHFPPPVPEIPVTQVIDVEGGEYYCQRRKIYEKFDEPPPLPPNLVIDKWFLGPEPPPIVSINNIIPCADDEKNLIINWRRRYNIRPPRITEVGVCCHMDPDEYVRKHGNNVPDLSQYGLGQIELPDLPTGVHANRCGQSFPADHLNFENDAAREQFARLTIDKLSQYGLERYARHLNNQAR